MVIFHAFGFQTKIERGRLPGWRNAFPRNASARLVEAGVGRSRTFSTGKREHRGQVSRFSSAMTRTKTRRALRPLVTCVRACRRSTLNSFQAFWQRSVPAILTFLLNSYLSKRNFFNESTVALRERSSNCPAKVACFLNFVSNARSVQPTDTIDTIDKWQFLTSRTNAKESSLLKI